MDTRSELTALTRIISSTELDEPSTTAGYIALEAKLKCLRQTVNRATLLATKVTEEMESHL